MARPGKIRRGSAPPPARGSTRRDSGDGRLDPVRWRRPGHGTLLRLAAVAVLLATAALMSWSPPESCTPRTGAAAVPPPSSNPAAAPPTQARAAPTTAIPSGSVGVPVRLADPTALSLVRPGNRVDLVRLDTTTGRTTAVAAAALVLKVTAPTDPTTGGLLLALTPPEAQRALPTGEGFAIVIRPD
jgi:hypothetical protein